MKGRQMADWYTLQLFVSEDGACEVMSDNEDYRKLKCTCSNWSWASKCKHVKHIKKSLDENSGSITIVIPPNVPDDEVSTARDSPESFREFLLKYGKVEYLP